MNRLDNFCSVSLDGEAMEHILGGMNNSPNPQAGAQAGVAGEAIKFVASYIAGKALDATAEAIKSTDWNEHSKKMDERMKKNFQDLCNDTTLPPNAW